MVLVHELPADKIGEQHAGRFVAVCWKSVHAVWQLLLLPLGEGASMALCKQPWMVFTGP